MMWTMKTEKKHKEIQKVQYSQSVLCHQESEILMYLLRLYLTKNKLCGLCSDAQSDDYV